MKYITNKKMNSIKQINNDGNKIKNELTELFKEGYEKIYFRDSDIDNGITERFNEHNKHIFCYICCEFEPQKKTKLNLHYYDCSSGSHELNYILKKNKLGIEWLDSCVAFLYNDA